MAKGSEKAKGYITCTPAISISEGTTMCPQSIPILPFLLSTTPHFRALPEESKASLSAVLLEEM
jgi:hypothetical protein